MDKEEICCRPFLIFKGVICGLSFLFARYLIGAVSILTVSFVTVSVMTAAMVGLSFLADSVVVAALDLEGNSALVLILVA